MYKVYSRPGSGSFVVEAALEMAGAPFECIDVPKTPQPDLGFLEISPLNQVPALALPDGHTMTESAAICILLAERFPQAALAPADGAGRADFLRWMALMASVVYPADLRFYYADRYTTDAGGADAVKQAAIAEMDRGLAVMDAALGGRRWLAGERQSVADLYLLMLFSWHPEVERAREAWKNIERVCAVLRDQPLIKRLNVRHEMW
ncbi:MAG: glutathione S-transferase family protein [Mesorhizobium sp.]